MLILTYIVFTLVTLIVAYDYINLIRTNPDSKRVIERIESNIISLDYEGNTFVIDTNEVATIKSIIVHNSIVRLPLECNGKKVKIINIEDAFECDKFTLNENIKRIYHLKINANEIDTTNSIFYVKNDCILDHKNNVIAIYKKKNFEELSKIAHEESISKNALHYFTNASYHQFVYYNQLYDLRFSKPYYDKNEELFAIVPEVIEGHKVEGISINYAYVKKINIPQNITRIIVEKKSEFEIIKISKQNKIFRIYGHTLANKEESKFIKSGNGTFNEVGYFDKKSIEFKKMSLTRVENCQYMLNK